ncbi:MAG: LPD38 domain-containing protein [Devosia sp.]
MPITEPLLPDQADEASANELVRTARRGRASKQKAWDLSPDDLDQLDAIGNGLASKKQQPAAAPAPEKPLGLLGTIKQGAIGTLRTLGATADTMQGDAEGVVKAAQEQAAAPKDPDLERFYAHIDEQKQTLGENPSLWEGIKAVGGAAIDNPRGFGLMVAEQLPNSAAALGAAGAGALAGSLAGPAGAVVGGLAGLAGANIGLETGAKALEAGQDGQVTPEEFSRVRREGLTKGAAITGVDALTLGATKWITGTTKRAVERATTKTLTDRGVDITSDAARKAAMETPEIADAVKAAQTLAKDGANKLGSRLARGGGAVALETVGEGAGEYLGELAATGKANAVDAVVEGFAGLGTSIGEISATAAMNRRGLQKLFDTQAEAEKTAEAQTKETGVEHEVIPNPAEPEKFSAVPKARSVGGIELERDAQGNLKPVQPTSTETEFNLANKPAFDQTAEALIRRHAEDKAREETYAANPIIIPGGSASSKESTIAGKPVTQLSNEALTYTANRGGEKAKQRAIAEIDRRTRDTEAQKIIAPERPTEAAKRIVATGAEKAQEDAEKLSVTPIPAAPAAALVGTPAATVQKSLAVGNSAKQTTVSQEAKKPDEVKITASPKSIELARITKEAVQRQEKEKQSQGEKKIVYPWEQTAGEWGVPAKPVDVSVPSFPRLEKISRETPEKLTTSDQVLLEQLKEAKSAHSKYLRDHKKYLPAANHHFAVIKNAVERGKFVPDKVLDEYPSLKALARSAFNQHPDASTNQKEFKSEKTSIPSQRDQAKNVQPKPPKIPAGKVTTQPTNNAGTESGSKDKVTSDRPAAPGKPIADVTKKAEPDHIVDANKKVDHPLRPLLESLIKKRAAAIQSGKGRSINTQIDRAKEVMVGTRKDSALESRWFRSQASAMKRADPATADILSKISDELKGKSAESPTATKPTKPDTTQKPAEKKPALSRAQPKKQTLATEKVKSVADAITAKWKNAPGVVIIDSMADAPEAVRSENDKQLSMGATGEPEGFIHNGKVYIVAGQMNSPADVVRVLLHESLGHFGLRGVFGNDLNAILKQVAALRSKDIAAKAKQYGLDISKEEDRLAAAEELLSEMAEKNPTSTIAQRAVAIIRSWLRRNIPGMANLKLSDAEIIGDFLIPARQFVQSGVGDTTNGKTALSRSEKTESDPFKKWFGNSKIVNEDGTPKVVYHGTDADISTFDKSNIGSRHPFSKEGFYFTSSTKTASIYADSITNAANGFRPNSPFAVPVRNGANVIPAYVSLQKPLIINTEDLTSEEKLDEDDGRLVRDAKKAGHDGVIIKRERGDEYDHIAVVAFRANQIKSTVNSGMFDPNNADIRFSRSPAAAITSAKASIKGTAEKAIDSLIYNYQDRFKPLKDIQERTGPVAEDQDAALAEERYSGTVRARQDNFEETLVDPLLKAIHDSKVSFEDAEEYLHARHAPERNAAMREINPTAPELDAQKAAAEAQRDSLAKDQNVKDYIAKRREVRDAKADIEDGIADESLGRMLDNELATIKKEQAVKDYIKTADKLRGLNAIKPFEGDNTALSGMSNAESKAILAKIDSNGTKKALDEISGIIDTITTATQKIYTDSGLEKPEAIAAWKEKYKNYVPLHRDEVSGNSMPRIGQGFNIKGKESKRATGSTKEVTHILAHVVAQHEAAIIRSEKAKVDQTLFKFAQANPDPNLWTLDNAPVMRTVDPVSGVVVDRIDPTYKNRDEVLTLKIDGEERTITFNDKNLEAMRLASSMKNLGADQLGEVTKLVGKFTRFLAMMNTTANPVFTVRNFLRDLQTAFINLSDTELAAKKKEVFKAIPAAIIGMWDLSHGKHSSKWAKEAKAYTDAGGQVGWMEHYKDIGERAENLKKEIEAMGPGKAKLAHRTLTNWWNLIQDANNAIENGVRLAAFVAARDGGMSPGRSAQLSKNLTVNFNTRGAKSVQLNMWYMFMNASVQGTARLVKALSNRQVQKIVAGVVVSGFLMDILARSLAGDDDEDGENDYDQLPEHVKAMNFVIWAGGRPITIPMPYGYNFFASAGRKVSEAIFRKDYSPAKSAFDLAAVFVDAFNPTGQAGSFLQFAAPTIADPFVQWAENKNFAGNPMRRSQNPFGVPKPEYQMGFKSTSAPAQWLAEKLNDTTGGNEVRPGSVNVNPAFFDFAVSSIAGGAGRSYLQATSVPLKVAAGDEIQAREVPFLNIFASAKPEYQTERKYFDAVKNVELARSELKTYAQKGDSEMVKQIREEHGGELRLSEAAKTTKTLLANLRKRELRLDKDQPENKRELKKQIEERKREIMSRFNKRYRDAALKP